MLPSSGKICSFYWAMGEISQSLAITYMSLLLHYISHDSQGIFRKWPKWFQGSELNAELWLEIEWGKEKLESQPGKGKLEPQPIKCCSQGATQCIKDHTCPQKGGRSDSQLCSENYSEKEMRLEEFSLIREQHLMVLQTGIQKKTENYRAALGQ